MAKKKEWSEGEIMLTFKLNKITSIKTPLMGEWLDVSPPQFNAVEEANFQTLLQKTSKVSSWSEENLKMKFISPILELGQILDSDKFVSSFDKFLEGQVEGYKLVVKADFMIGKGRLDYLQTPYFHFQEYKPQKNPTGDPMAQLLEAFLIGQAKNETNTPIYGCEVVGANWRFVVMENKDYCVSKVFDSTDKDDLLQIIAILRKFRDILETILLG